MNRPSKSWCFTLNNYTEANINAIKAWADDCNRLAVGKEVGESGTPHLQGAVTWKGAKRLSALKKLLPTAHWEVMKASTEAFIYAIKDGDIVVDINNKRQGKRSDIEDAVQALVEGQPLKRVCVEHTAAMVRYGKGIRQIAAMIADKPVEAEYKTDDFPWEALSWDDGKVKVLCGESGIGKTQFALSHFKSPLFVTHMDQLATFDPHTHDGLIFDDMSFSHMPRTAQIHILDWDQPRVIHVRYSTALIPAHTRKVITTNVADVVDWSDGAIARRARLIELGPREPAQERPVVAPPIVFESVIDLSQE